jgi:hypothetical protein
MAANYTCDANQLITNAACFRDGCMGKDERDSIDVYLRVANLAAAAGGANYLTDLNGLLQAAKLFQIFYASDRDAIELWIDMQNAVFNGAIINETPSSLAAKAKCYLCLGRETRKNVLTFLKCALNTLDQPD